MKKLVYFLFAVLLVLGLAILGNMLRCMMARGSACPGWCYVKPVQCLNSECQLKLACQAPGWSQYGNLVSDWWTAWQTKGK